MAVTQPTECSTAARRIRKPSLSCLRPLVGVLITKSMVPEAIISIIFGWASDTRATRVQGTPASSSVCRVPSVARISMPISEKRRAMPMHSRLSSSFTVMITRPPRLGARILAPLKAFNSAWGKDSAMPSTSPVDFISGPRPVSTSVSFSKENTGIFTAK